MSNSAFMIPKKFPTVTEIDAALRKIVAECFPAFNVSACDGGWLVQHPVNSELAFNVWLEKHQRRKALAIPHKHCYEIMWWVEYEVRERLARDFDASQYDEGAGHVENSLVFYSTYSDYLTAVYPPDYREFKVMMAAEEASLLPDDLRAKLGQLFQPQPH